MRLTILISALLFVMVFYFLPVNDAFAKGRGSGGQNGPGGACYKAEASGCNFALDQYHGFEMGDNWLYREPFVFGGVRANFRLTYVLDTNKGWMCANDTLTAGCNADGVKLTTFLSGDVPSNMGLPPSCGMWVKSVDVPCLNTSIGKGFATTAEILTAIEESLEDQFPCDPADCSSDSSPNVDIQCFGSTPCCDFNPERFQVTCEVPLPFASRCRYFDLGLEAHLTHNSNAAAIPDSSSCGGNTVDARCINTGNCVDP